MIRATITDKKALAAIRETAIIKYLEDHGFSFYGTLLKKAH